MQTPGAPISTDTVTLPALTFTLEKNRMKVAEQFDGWRQQKRRDEPNLERRWTEAFGRVERSSARAWLRRWAASVVCVADPGQHP